MIEEYRLLAIESLLIKKGILTKDEIKCEYDRLLKEKWDNDKNDKLEQNIYK